MSADEPTCPTCQPNPTPPSAGPSEALDGMSALADGVAQQKWPHTVDARVWVEEWSTAIAAHPEIPTDPGAMLGWFANAIMAGHDTASAALAQRLREVEARLSTVIRVSQEYADEAAQAQRRLAQLEAQDKARS